MLRKKCEHSVCLNLKLGVPGDLKAWCCRATGVMLSCYSRATVLLMTYYCRADDVLLALLSCQWLDTVPTMAWYWPATGTDLIFYRIFWVYKLLLGFLLSEKGRCELPLYACILLTFGTVRKKEYHRIKFCSIISKFSRRKNTRYCQPGISTSASIYTIVFMLLNLCKCGLGTLTRQRPLGKFFSLPQHLASNTSLATPR